MKKKKHYPLKDNKFLESIYNRVLAGDEKARNLIYTKETYDFVKIKARKFGIPQNEMDCVCQEALEYANERFLDWRPDGGASISTFICRNIISRIQDCQRNLLRKLPWRPVLREEKVHKVKTAVLHFDAAPRLPRLSLHETIGKEDINHKNEKLREVLETAVEKLPLKYQRLATLYFLEGKTLEEISTFNLETGSEPAISYKMKNSIKPRLKQIILNQNKLLTKQFCGGIIKT